MLPGTLLGVYITWGKNKYSRQEQETSETMINSKSDFYLNFSHKHYDIISGWKNLRKIKVNVIETHFNIPVASYVVSAYILFA